LGVGGRLGLFLRGVHELQLIDNLLHPVMPFLGRGIAGKSQLGRIIKGAPRGQLVVDDVFLGYQADAVAQLGVVRVKVAVVVQDGAFVRGPNPGQGAEQGRLSRPARADDRHQAALADREAHPVQENLRSHPHRQAPGDQRDVALVDELP
jgi:hypothetical protein